MKGESTLPVGWMPHAAMNESESCVVRRRVLVSQRFTSGEPLICVAEAQGDIKVSSMIT